MNLNKCIFLLFFLVLFACDNNKISQKKIASVGKYTLYLEELSDALPENISGKDSIQFAQNYINQWLSSKILLIKASENINVDEKKIDKQIEDYKNSLIIYEYQKMLIYQKLDTLVSDAEISTYYEEHQNDFLLKDNIIKVAYVKLPKEASNTKQLRQMLKEYTVENSYRLRDFADKFAVNYFIDDEIWLIFNDFLKEVPIKTYNQEMYLKNNNYVEFQDSLFQYFVRINGFKIKDAISPISFEYEKIRSLIINQRKIKLINEMETEIFKDAQKSGDIKIYN